MSETVKLTLRDDATPQAQCDNFFDDVNNGYIKPDLVLETEEQAEAVTAAMNLLDSFRDLLIENDMLEIM